MESGENAGIWEKIKKFNFEAFLEKNKIVITLLLSGLILLGLGVFYFKNGKLADSNKIEVIETPTGGQENGIDMLVEISGAVEKPGVYKLSQDSRIEDLLIKSGGLSIDADRGWVERYINRAAKLTDGQKIYVPRINEQSGDESAKNSSGYQSISTVQGSSIEKMVNINTATLKELDTLPGIGPVYGQNIIEHRPYSTVEELLTKSVLKKNVYEKIKDKVTIY